MDPPTPAFGISRRSIPGLQLNTKSGLKTPRAIPGFVIVDPKNHAVALVPQTVADGDEQAAGELLPLVYEELRSLARSRMGQLAPGQTLQPTALVHEAYLRVIGDADPGWDGRGHFFAAAAQALRQIIVEHRAGRPPRVSGDISRWQEQSNRLQDQVRCRSGRQIPALINARAGI